MPSKSAFCGRSFQSSENSDLDILVSPPPTMSNSPATRDGCYKSLCYAAGIHHHREIYFRSDALPSKSNRCLIKCFNGRLPGPLAGNTDVGLVWIDKRDYVLIIDLYYFSSSCLLYLVQL